MMDFNERVIPGVSANFLFKEALARYVFCKKFAPKNGLILDFGCGCGYGTYLLARNSFAIGVDINREAIEFARRNYKGNLQFIVGGIDQLKKFEDKSFDLVCSFEVIEHLDEPSQFFGEAKRILKKGGHLILSTPNRLIHSPDGVIRSQYHLREYDPRELEEILVPYFRNIIIFGQSKSKRALTAINEFMKSQKHRERFVKRDFLGIRRFVPKGVKEYLWKHLGSFYGRKPQDFLKTKDFPIGKLSNKSDYLIAVCQK